jgi:RNA polymerase sigma-70 factor (ECF subfamily)
VIRVSPVSPPVAYSEWTDNELVDSFFKQREGAYAELFRRHSGSVGWVAERILGRHGSSEDVVHEVFVSLWQFPETFDPTRGTVLGFMRLKARGCKH